MLFVPPSMPLMIPEAFAIQDKGDFKLEYGPAEGYTEFESWIKSTQYFETQVAWLNEKLRLPNDVIVIVGVCGMVNAFYQYNPDTNKSFIVYCYEFMADNWEKMDFLRLNGHEFAPDIFCHPAESYCATTAERTLNVIDSVFYHELGHAVIHLYDLPVPGLY